MKNNIKILFILFLLFIAGGKLSAADLFTGSVNPHDSLLFDGANRTSLNIAAYDNGCYIQVGNIRGKATGKVLKKEITRGCGDIPETLITEVDKQLEKGDIVVEGTYLETGQDSYVGLGLFFSGDMNELGEYRMQSIVLGITANSMIIVPRVSYYCARVKEKEEKLTQKIPVIKGIVTYDQVPGTGPKFNTTGKRSSAKHTKTRYSHEVKIEGVDTIDVIRVYEGSVEVTYLITDVSNEEANAKEMEKLSQDVQEGKITMEEFQAKVNGFVSGSQNFTDLLTPVNVDEGFKCTVTKNSRNVEPLGPGDSEIK